MNKKIVSALLCGAMILGSAVPAMAGSADGKKIALVGKYIQLHDAYISVVEALKHGGIFQHATVNIKWVDSEQVTTENVAEQLKDVSGVIVPGGFGDRGIEGMITSIRYARENNIPFLGLCLGMQMAIVEFARHVLDIRDGRAPLLT